MQNNQHYLEDEIYTQGIIIIDRDIRIHEIKGIFLQNICGKFIIINKNIPTVAERVCVLAEELGHYYTSSGNLILYGYDTTIVRKQERTARIWAYKRLVPPTSVNNAYQSGMTCVFDCSEHFGVTEQFMRDSIEYYMQAGLFVSCDQGAYCGQI